MNLRLISFQGLSIGLASYLNSPLSRQLARALSGTFALKVSALLLGFLSHLLLARLLGAHDYGLYSYALAWINLLYIPAMLGLDKLLVREVSIAEQGKDLVLIRAILRWSNRTALAVGAVLVVGTALVVTVISASGEGEMGAVILIALPLLPLLALTTLRQSALQGLKHVVVGQLPESVVRPLLLIAALMGAYLLSPSGRLTAEAALMANIGSAALAFTVGVYLLSRYLPKVAYTPADPARRRAWLRSAVPLGLLAVMQAANAQATLLILGAFVEPAELGLYSAAQRLSSLGSFIPIAFNLAIAPHVADLYSRKDLGRLQRLVTLSARATLLLTLPVALIFVFLGRFLLGVFGEEYVGAHGLLLILAVGMLFNAAMGSVGLLLTMTGHERAASLGIGFCLVLNLIVSLLLIPPFGVYGAAVAVSAYTIAWNVLFAVFVRRRTRIMPSAFSRTTHRG